ncbi:MAG: hypothetical protein P9L99_18540 [Candidatus Lernaella stagnicola]|nr:hypothetical protein [Candidatus Lernaella stagnicola]
MKRFVPALLCGVLLAACLVALAVAEPSTEARLEPRVRVVFFIPVKAATFAKLEGVVAEFARRFPDGFTKTTFPKSPGDPTTFEGAWLNADTGAVARDHIEILFVDLPARNQEWLKPAADFKEYLHAQLGEKEIWVTAAPLQRVLSPSSPGWSASP